ncbi:MAG TPA: hypothetical protein EYQ82_05785 [Dehalococcoidia bacterium]|nr:hypothetical protein [Dehalococcoidia bacterium]
MTTYEQDPLNPPGPDEHSGPGGTFTAQTYLAEHTLQFVLIRDQTNGVFNALVQVAIKFALVLTGLWRGVATSLNAFPAGLGVHVTYRPDRSIPTPLYQSLRAVGLVREVIAVGARVASRVMSSHQRLAFRVHGSLLAQRTPNYPT